jgi:hypothetical protein
MNKILCLISLLPSYVEANRVEIIDDRRKISRDCYNVPLQRSSSHVHYADEAMGKKKGCTDVFDMPGTSRYGNCGKDSCRIIGVGLLYPQTGMILVLKQGYRVLD